MRSMKEVACRQGMAVLTCLLGLMLAAGQSGASGPDGQTAGAATVKLANPASVHCVQQGGTLEIRERPGGGQYGVCVFTDNLQCEEWALLRGTCPPGGVRITGYDTPAQIYCAITGGEVDMRKDTCRLPDGRRCALQTHFRGLCQTD